MIKEPDNLTVTADGVKSYKTLLNELATALLTFCQGLKNDEEIYVTQVKDSIGGGTNYSLITKRYKRDNSIADIGASFNGLLIQNNTFTWHTFVLSTKLGGCKLYEMACASSGNTFTDMTNDVPSNGVTLQIFYQLYKTV